MKKEKTMTKKEKQLTKGKQLSEEEQALSEAQVQMENLTFTINGRINRAIYVIKGYKQDLEALAKQLKIKDVDTLITEYALEIVAKYIEVNHDIDMEEMALHIIGSAKVSYYNEVMKNFKTKVEAEKAKKMLTAFIVKWLETWYVEYGVLELGDYIAKRLLPKVAKDEVITNFVSKNKIEDEENLFTYIYEAALCILFTKYRKEGRNAIDKKMVEISTNIMNKSFKALTEQYPKLAKQIKALKDKNAERFASFYYNKKW